MTCFFYKFDILDAFLQSESNTLNTIVIINSKNGIGMKKLILFLSLFLVAFYAQATKVDIVDIQGKELVIIVDRTAQNTFSTYYVFQYNNLDFSFLKKYHHISLAMATKEEIKLNCDNQIITLSIDKETERYKGYGLSKQAGRYQLPHKLPSIGTVRDVVQSADVYLSKPTHETTDAKDTHELAQGKLVKYFSE